MVQTFVGCSIVETERKRRVSQEVMTNKVTVIFDLLCTLMKDIIVSNLNGTTIVTMKEDGTLLRGIHISKESTKS